MKNDFLFMTVENWLVSATTDDYSATENTGTFYSFCFLFEIIYTNNHITGRKKFFHNFITVEIG